MIRQTIALGLFFWVFLAHAQEDVLDEPEPAEWQFKGTYNVSFNQTLLSQWNAGGQNNTNAGVLIRQGLIYRKNKVRWENLVDLAYGVNYQDDVLRKIDDKLEWNSRFDLIRHQDPLWKWSAFGSFKTQFFHGYSIPGDSLYASNFLAPAYGLGGLGITHKTNGFDFYASPFTGKWTIVNDARLSDEGAFGVTPGAQLRQELGANINLRWQHSYSKTIKGDLRLNVFENYLEPVLIPDMNGDLLLVFKGEGPLSVTLRSQFIYDGDVMVKDSNGDGKLDAAGLQLKQLTGVGLTYQIGNS